MQLQLGLDPDCCSTKSNSGVTLSGNEGALKGLLGVEAGFKASKAGSASWLWSS